MEDYITDAWLEEKGSSKRLIIQTTNGTAKIGISPSENFEALVALLPFMQGARITEWLVDQVQKHVYLSFEGEGYHKFIEFDYDIDLPLEADQLDWLN